jgi:glycogen synthase
MGGLAPVPTAYMRGLIKEGTFKLSAVIPKWESSLREFNELSTKEIKNIERLMPDDVYFVSHPSFNKVKTQGSNTRIYDNSRRFTSIDRAIAFSAGITNIYLMQLRPDIVWLQDWMLGPVAPVAKALGIKVVATCHNPIFTQLATLDELVNKGVEVRDFDTSYKPSEWIYLTKDAFDNNIEKFDFMATEINAADDFTTVSEGVLERMLNGSFDERAPSVMHAVKEKAKHKHPDGRSRVHGYTNPLKNDKSNFLSMIKKDGLENTINYRKNNAVELRRKTGLNPGGTFVIYANRLYEQKYPELIIDNAIEFAIKHDLRILINANGDEQHINRAKEIAFKSNGLVAYFQFSEELENFVKESDNSYGLMTPRFEPCGGQNINYPAEATLVVGHAIDGIKDTVHKFDAAKSKGNGIPYAPNNAHELDKAFSEMKAIANLPEDIRYEQYIRIANETLRNHSSLAFAKKIVNEVFLPVYEEGKAKRNRTYNKRTH